ncbi:LysR substrate-binding domain-containing protein [Paenirhodobacter sp.]|uniref:LysR substrate-binding domain-containing protein n=1 Tax=Paenirhodobacter sp. TaxID=1965326 RepID=UPI003B3DCC10
MQIGKLEETLGRPLLLREPKVAPTSAGTDLLAYARRLLTISDEAWASVTRPEETGTVRLGVPEDYAMLLPGTLERFGRDFPKVTVELVCEPTISLTRAIEAQRIDLAIVTRFGEVPATVIRREPMVWLMRPGASRRCRSRCFCAAWVTILKALSEAERPFRCTYSSANLAGMIAIVQAGLAVAGVARCSAPPGLRVVGEAEGLPPIPELEIGLLRGPRPTAAAQRLEDALLRDLGTAG